jgi:hypothetical protein
MYKQSEHFNFRQLINMITHVSDAHIIIYHCAKSQPLRMSVNALTKVGNMSKYPQYWTSEISPSQLNKQSI